MKLSDYLIQLSRDDTKAPEDRVLYLYDTVNNTYYIKVIHPSSYDRAYIFFTYDEPFHDFEKVNVIRAWTVVGLVNCVMGLNAMIENYGESEV